VCICVHSFSYFIVNEDVLMANELLSQRYTQSRFIPPEDDWPPYYPKHYTPLTIIHHERRWTESEITALAHELGTKGSAINKPCDYASIYDGAVKGITELFAMCEDLSFMILVEGAPGIGKTILSKEIASKWASKVVLKNKRLLFLLFMHDPQIKGITSILTLVRYFCQDETLAGRVTTWLVKTNGKYVTIVLDGYDEISDQNRSHFINIDIIGRRIIPECSLVITSRPVASSHLHSSINYRVEVLGFSNVDRHDFIRNSLHDKIGRAKVLETFLQSNPVINALCYIPLNMSILLCLAEEGIDNLPKTRTNLFRSFIVMAITHFLKRENVAVSTTITDLSDLPPPYNQLIKELSHFAFLALQKDQIVFTLAEVETTCPSMAPSDWYRFGLLKPVKYFKAQDGCDHESLHFLHLSVQEYLAAYYIASLPDKALERLLNATFWELRYLNAWKMFVGITGGDRFAFKHFLSSNRPRIGSHIFGTSNISPKIVTDKIKCLHLIQCLSETDNGVLQCLQGIFQNNKIIDVSNQLLSYNDVHTLAVLLLQSPKKQWEKLDISACSIDDRSCSVLCEAFSHQTVPMHVDIVNISGNNFHYESLSKLCSVLKGWQTKELIVSVDMLYDSDTASLIRATTDKLSISIPKYPNTSVFPKTILYSYSAEQSLMVAVYSSASNLTSRHFPDYELSNQIPENLITFAQCAGKGAHIRFSYGIPAKCAILLSNFNCVTFSGCNMFSKGICNVVDELNKCSVLVSLDYHCYTSWNQLAADYLAGVVCHVPSNKSCLSMISSPNAIDLSNKFSRLDALHIFKIDTIDVTNNMISSEKANDLALLLLKSELEKLVLNDNQLTASGLVKIIIAFKSVSDITTLCIGNNDINNDAIDALGFVLANSHKLKHLDIRGNKFYPSGIARLAKALCKTSSLTTLDVSKNGIGSDVANEIAVALSGNSKLQSLSMDNNRLKTSGIIIIAQSLQRVSSLTSLNISNNDFNSEAADSIAIVLHHNISLQHLNISKNNLQTVGAVKIAKGLQGISTLLTLDISDNNIGSAAAADIAAVLSCNTNLQKVMVGGNQLQSLGIIKILTSLQNNSALTMFDAFNNDFSSEVSDDFVSVLSHSTALECLNLGHINLQAAGMSKIAKALQNTSNLKMFNICANNISNKAADDIAGILYHNSNLQYLDIHNNRLQSSGITKILQSLKNTSTLTMLDISDSNIDPDTADDIATVIFHNPALKHLDLCKNNLQTVGIIKIAKALQKTSMLQGLIFSQNKIGCEAADYIAAALLHNTKLKVLDIGIY